MSRINPMHHGKGDDTFDEQSVNDCHDDEIKHWLNNAPLTRAQVESILTHAHYDSIRSCDDNCDVLCEKLLSYLDKGTDMSALPF